MSGIEMIRFQGLIAVNGSDDNVVNVQVKIYEGE